LNISGVRFGFIASLMQEDVSIDPRCALDVPDTKGIIRITYKHEYKEANAGGGCRSPVNNKWSEII
jgi:hypothetical protein